MKKAPTPLDEAQRLQALHELEILDTAEEAAYDALTRLAAHIAGTPIALISLVDANRQWFKSHHGLDARETPRDISFCGHAVFDRAPLVVEDSHADPRFSDNPLVTGPPHLRFYAGHPLITEEGHAVGTLCVIDDQPRQLSAEQLGLLADVADLVLSRFQLKRSHDALDQSQKELFQAARDQSTLAAIVESSELAILSKDLEGRITSFNQAAEALYGYRADAVIGRPITTLVPPSRHGEVADILATICRGERVREMETVRRHKDGREMDVRLQVSPVRDGAGVVVGASVLAKDISEERRLEAERRRLMSVVESAPELIALADANGTLSYLNRGGLALLETSSAATLKSFRQLIAPEFRSAFLERALPTAVNRGLWRGEGGLLSHSGTSIPALITLIAHHAESGGVEYLSLMALDIRERKAAERLKDEFISTVSHELRTPLTSIRGSLGLLAGGVTGELSDQAQGLLSIAVNNVDRLVRLINDILDVERIEAGRLELQRRPVDLCAVVQKSIQANASYAARYETSFALQCPPHPVEVIADPDRIAQVMDNLLSNAAKFTTRGTVVDVSVALADGATTTRVRDRGPGIPADFRGKVFRRFAQADSTDQRRKGGTGLGLSIVKAIVEAHGGHIDFESRDDGTEFWFRLPAIPHVTADAPLRHVLLVVEDNAVAEVLSKMLAARGAACTTAACLADADAALLTGKISGVVIDMSGSAESRARWLAELRTKHPASQMPVAIITASSSDARVHGTGLGVADWLTKPIDADRLAAALRASSPPGTARAQVLHVEDDPDLRNVVAALLSDAVDTVAAATLDQARTLLATRRFDLALVDLGLPDGSGLDLLPDLGELGVPAVLFSASEVSAEIAAQVEAALVKSQTSEERLVAIVNRCLKLEDS